MKAKDYVKKWRTSLLKETVLLGFLFLSLCFCMLKMYQTDSMEVAQKCGVYYDVFGTIALLTWAQWIKNEHELACYRGTALTFIGLMVVWGCTLLIPTLEVLLFFFLVFISAVALYPNLRMEEKKEK